MLAGRSLTTAAAALVQRRHYATLVNMVRIYPRAIENAWRYLTGRGTYPYDVAVRTPRGTRFVRLYSHHDLLSLNEIFCRRDYPASSRTSNVLDLGSNIGISALFFLTRNSEVRCTLYEPDPRNVERLRRNLQGFEDRYELEEAAVSDRRGEVSFGVEPTGRYGGIGVATGSSITVPCVHVSQAIETALEVAPTIDILKVDTEGVELQTVMAIQPDQLARIDRIYLEARPAEDVHPGTFRNKQYGSVRQLIRRA